ncbi:MAG: hypothetical protein AAF629_31070 [Chloroflexota bacterium]
MIQAKLGKGITAAKNGDRPQAREILYDIVDQEPKNEVAWVWLSYVVDTIEDRQICLENVLFINPDNAYAQRGLQQIRTLLSPNSAAESSDPGIEVKTTQQRETSAQYVRIFLVINVAFWTGIGALFSIFGILDIVTWGIDISNSRSFPRYITTYQLMTLTIAIIFFVAGVVSLNLAWAIHKRYRSGYYVSLILALGFAFIGPLSTMILENPNYILIGFMAFLPILIFIATLLSQPAFTHD